MDFGNSWRPSVDTSQRNYKTKWLTDLGQIGYYPDQNYRGEGHVTSKIPLWKPGTERGYVTTGGKRGKGFYGNHKVAGGIKDPGLEIIDWEAYDKDPMYKGWLSSQGRDQFKTVEDIHSAEDWLIGGTKEKVARDELNALKLKLEREQTLRQEERTLLMERPIILGFKSKIVSITLQFGYHPLLLFSGLSLLLTELASFGSHQLGLTEVG